MTGKIDCFGQTDVGCLREANEDQFLIADIGKTLRVNQTSLGLDRGARLFGGTQGTLLLVADGMGGEAHGDRASQLAVDAVMRTVLDDLQWPFDGNSIEEEQADRGTGESELGEVPVACQSALSNDAGSSASKGTTLTATFIQWPQMTVVHLGDSRCYLFRDGQLRQLTQDHTMARALIDQGAASEKEMQSSPLSHTLWNFIGSKDNAIDPQLIDTTLQIDDTLLLCTDGLNAHVSDDRIVDVLTPQTTAETAAARLIAAAKEDGGRDNITVVVARFVEGQPQAEHERKSATVSEPASARADRRTTLTQNQPPDGESMEISV